MAKSKQIHIFATRPDLVPGLAKVESEIGLQYARCGRYSCGSELEQYLSLMEWEGLGKNITGDHISGPRFLVMPKSQKIHLESLAPSSSRRAGRQNAIVVDDAGGLSRSALSLDKALALLEHGTTPENPALQPGMACVLSQKLNPDSIVFSPGGVYKDQPAIIAGHIATISESSNALTLYKGFVKAITKGFEKIGSYYVGPEAARLMEQGHRMVTIGLGSPALYDLKRV
jgi:hypothetical protein